MQAFLLKITLFLKAAILINFMKIVTYNVNGIRAAMSKGLIEWIKQVNPDVLCVQEIKANPEQVGVFEFEEL